ncbi:hypothetical protein EMIT0196MI5_200057 [Pseudomonas sp. IT-196MI5]|uniref:hypothetical protein n=1 Tax=unclassified Pseudomonas TaxID=196821 RepID=UPI0039E0F0E2
MPISLQSFSGTQLHSSCAPDCIRLSILTSFVLLIVPIFIAAVAAWLKNRSDRSNMTGVTH